MSAQFDFESGEILLINKPHNWTSFDVVNKIRYAVQTKVGHAGTLDPLATGLLIVATGKATKRLQEFQDLDKRYSGTMRLGETTSSYDGETEVNKEFDVSKITEDMIRETAQQFVGEIAQIPPAHSAVQVRGKKSYVLARKGQQVNLGERHVRIDRFDIVSVQMPDVHFQVSCSKGTYIRSLAHDFGKALNNGAWLTQLCRTGIGPYRVEDAHGIDEFLNLVESQ